MPSRIRPFQLIWFQWIHMSYQVHSFGFLPGHWTRDQVSSLSWWRDLPKICYHVSTSETPVMKLWILVLICFTRTYHFINGCLFQPHRPPQNATGQLNINKFGPHKSDRCILTSAVRPVRSHTASLSVVRGLTNWFSHHLGACVQRVMVYPAQKNQNQI